MTSEPRPRGSAQPLPRLLVWAALALALSFAYLAVEMLVGFVQRPLERGERFRSFAVVQLLLLAIVALAIPLFGHFFPRRIGRLPGWAKLSVLLLAPLPICYAPLPALFEATVDRRANQREIDLYRNASSSLRATLDACRVADGRFPENPAQCLNRGALAVKLGGVRGHEVKYHSDGRRYALGFAGSDPARDRAAVILFWSDTSAWSWHDYATFATAVRGEPAREHLGFACALFEGKWECRAPGY